MNGKVVGICGGLLVGDQSMHVVSVGGDESNACGS